MVHCKICNGIEFTDFSALRKHQWMEHKNLYKKVVATKQKWSKAQRAKYKATIAAKNGHVNSVRGFLNGATGAKITSEMTAKEVLDELKKQRDFMNDIVDMVENLIK